MLPGKDGFEALSEIRKSRNLPVLMMSAKTDDDSKILGMEIGADDYVDKPFSIPVLTSKIKALMRRTYEITEEKEILSAEEQESVPEDGRSQAARCFDRISGRFLGEEIPINLKR